MQIILY